MSSLITLPAPRRPLQLAPTSGVQLQHTPPRRLQRIVTHPAPWLALICTAQLILTRVTSSVATAFEDEGLYIYFGHRMIDHFLHGTFLQEFPGAFFSGAPGIYPVLAALADDVGGLAAVRTLSLIFAMVATVGVYGIGSQLFGRLPGLLGAATFAVCGSVVYQSQWATYDAMTLALLTLAAWLAVTSARRDGLLWAPAVAGLLVLAVLTKYAAMAYVPFIIALAVTEGWPRWRWSIVRRALFALAATAAGVYFVLMLWGRDLLHGIAQTTTSRQIIQPTPRSDLVRDVVQWAGPWLALGALGAFLLVTRDRRRTLTACVVLGAALIGAAQQVRIGELTSLGKHLAFGVAFAAPLAGYLLAAVARRRRWYTALVALVPVAAVLAALTLHGVHTADSFRTGYPDDARLVAVLRQAVHANPGRPILGEKPSPERYALRTVTEARQWSDTYQFSYAGLSGPDAYKRALREHYFGVIYLSFSTPNATVVINNLGAAQVGGHYYNLIGKVPRYVRGERSGDWLIWAPQTTPLTPIG